MRPIGMILGGTFFVKLPHFFQDENKNVFHQKCNIWCIIYSKIELWVIAWIKKEPMSNVCCDKNLLVRPLKSSFVFSSRAGRKEHCRYIQHHVESFRIFLRTSKVYCWFIKELFFRVSKNDANLALKKSSLMNQQWTFEVREKHFKSFPRGVLCICNVLYDQFYLRK